MSPAVIGIRAGQLVRLEIWPALQPATRCIHIQVVVDSELAPQGCEIHGHFRGIGHEEDGQQPDRQPPERLVARQAGSDGPWACGGEGPGLVGSRRAANSVINMYSRRRGVATTE